MLDLVPVCYFQVAVALDVAYHTADLEDCGRNDVSIAFSRAYHGFIQLYVHFISAELSGLSMSIWASPSLASLSGRGVVQRCRILTECGLAWRRKFLPKSARATDQSRHVTGRRFGV